MQRKRYDSVRLPPTTHVHTTTYSFGDVAKHRPTLSPWWRMALLAVALRVLDEA